MLGELAIKPNLPGSSLNTANKCQAFQMCLILLSPMNFSDYIAHGNDFVIPLRDS